MNDIDKSEVMKVLNAILKAELAGVVRYTHYSFMVFGYGRIPIVSWLRSQATECLQHAEQAGELITHFGEHPSLAIGELLETQQHDIGDILRESLAYEKATLEHYHRLLELVKDKDVMLEEYARQLIAAEQQHLGEVDKMLRRPGELRSVK